MNFEKVYQMDFQKIYQCLVNKAIKKGRTQEEVDEIICWLTGYSQQQLTQIRKTSSTYGEFFQNAPKPNEKRLLIKGSVCGVRVEAVEEPLMREIRYLDKLIDDLAKGKSMDSILMRNC